MLSWRGCPSRRLLDAVRMSEVDEVLNVGYG
jgi:hypothetical protein